MTKESIMGGSIVRDRPLSPYGRRVLESAERYGGLKNFHTHLDRADTLDGKYLANVNLNPIEAASMSLKEKQHLTGYLHQGPAYKADNLRERITKTLERLEACGTTGIWSCVDTAPDIGEKGLLAMRVLGEIRDEFSGRIEIKRAPNPIFGFKKDSGRWELFCEASEIAEFLSCLPEKDDGGSDGRVGFRRHIRMVMELGCKLKKEVHLHLDQANDPSECGTEILIEGLRWLDQPQIPGHDGPVVWVIHAISPSAYDEERFKRLIDGLLELNIGVIVCPTAALSMRQLRPVFAPQHSSIARMLELCKCEVPVRLGSDNIADVFVPQGDGDMLTEIIMAGHALRFASPHVWAKLGAGEPLNDSDRATIGETLYQDRKVFALTDSEWRAAIE